MLPIFVYFFENKKSNLGKSAEYMSNWFPKIKVAGIHLIDLRAQLH